MRSGRRLRTLDSRFPLVAIAVTATITSAFLAPLAVGSSSVQTDERVVVTRDALDLPAGCSPVSIADALGRYFTALVDGDMATVERAFVEEDPPGRAIEPAGRQFRWYSVTELSAEQKPMSHFVAYDLRDLFPYLTERRRQNERLSLVAMEIGRSSIPGAAGITFVVRREAGDLADGLGGTQRVARGKAGISCSQERIYQWSMGMEMAPGKDLARSYLTCPLPRGWRPANPPVACSRGPNASAAAESFRAPTGATSLPKKCKPAHVAAKVRSALSTFNAGQGSRFSRVFARVGVFRPYTAPHSIGGLVGRTRIARFASLRYRSGDGWTATALELGALRDGGRSRAYRIRLALTHQGRPIGTSSATIVVGCKAGLINSWVGPAVARP
jgi:hypothetical protein